MTRGPVELAVEVDEQRLPVPPSELSEICARAVALCGLPGALSLALIDDATMRRLNRDFHDCDAATDVLAFPLAGPEKTVGPGRGDVDVDVGVDGPPGFAAEIVVSYDTAEREAAARGVDTIAEVLLYVVHGTLHLLGYDDHDVDDARTMHSRTLEVLRELGYENTIEVEEG